MTEELQGKMKIEFKTLVPILVFLLVQTIAAIWWASSLSTKTEYMYRDIIEVKSAIKDDIRFRYTSEDATQDKRTMLDLIKAQSDRIDRQESRIDGLERQLIKGP